MRWPTRLLMLAVLLHPCGIAWAEEDDPRAKIAAIAALAEIAPTVCPDVETRAAIVAQWLERSGLTQADLTERYGETAHAIAESFLASAKQDQPAACAQIEQGLGADGLGLLGPKAK